jgi:hypothetical protein
VANRLVLGSRLAVSFGFARHPATIGRLQDDMIHSVSRSRYKLTLPRGDVRIKTEEICRIIPFLKGHQAFVICPESHSNTWLALLTQIVQVHPSTGKRLKSIMQALYPLLRRCFSRRRPFLEHSQTKAVTALPEIESHFGFRNSTDGTVQIMIKRECP